MNLNDALSLTLAEQASGDDATYPALSADNPFEHVGALRQVLQGFDDVTCLRATYSHHSGGNCYWHAFLTTHGEQARVHVIYWDGWFELPYSKGSLAECVTAAHDAGEDMVTTGENA